MEPDVMTFFIFFKYRWRKNDWSLVDGNADQSLSEISNDSINSQIITDVDKQKSWFFLLKNLLRSSDLICSFHRWQHQVLGKGSGSDKITQEWMRLFESQPFRLHFTYPGGIIPNLVKTWIPWERWLKESMKEVMVTLKNGSLPHGPVRN